MSVQIRFRQIYGTLDRRESEALHVTGGVEIRRTALLSQEGSTIETAVEIVRGVVPELHSLRMHTETFRLGNHPSRHRKERDDAALLTQEGNSPGFPHHIPPRGNGHAAHKDNISSIFPLLSANASSRTPVLSRSVRWRFASATGCSYFRCRAPFFPGAPPTTTIGRLM